MRSGNGGRWGAISQGREFFPKRFFAVLVHLLAVFRNEEKKKLFFELSDHLSN